MPAETAPAADVESQPRFVDSPPTEEPFDAQIAISSLPHAFGTRLDTIPANVPYLSPEPPLQELWAGASARPALRSASSGRAIRTPRRTAPAQCRSRPSRRSPKSPVCGLSRCRRGTARSNSPDCRRRYGSKRSVRSSTRARRLRRHGGGDDAMRSHCHLRHVDRPSRRGSGAPGLGRFEERRRMAMDDRARRLALVPDDASLPPVAARRLARRVDAMARELPRLPRPAPRRG